MPTPGTQASKYDKLKQLIEASDAPTLKRALAVSKRWSTGRRSVCVSMAAKRGSAEALALVLTAGCSPQWQWKLWVNSATSTREPETKIAHLLSLGLKPPAHALRIYAEDELTNGDVTDHVTPTALLLAAGADINARTDYGWTPLMIAVLKQDLAWVRQLVAAGADTRLGATSTNHPWFDDEYPVGVRVTPAEWARRKWKLSGETEQAWHDILAALEGPATKRARTRPAKAQPRTGLELSV